MIIPAQGDPYTEDFYPAEDDTVKVVLTGAYRPYIYTPEIDGHLLILTDPGTLPKGLYGVQITVTGADGETRLRSFWDQQIVVTERNNSVLKEWDEFKDQPVQARAAVFFFAKGDKGDPFTYQDFTPEEIEELQKPASDAAAEPYWMIHAKKGIYADGDVQALGHDPQQGGGGGGASVLYELNDVSPNAAHNAVLGIIIDDQNPQGDGYVLTYDYNSKHWIAAPAAETYRLPQATAQALGGIMIGYTPGQGETRNYAVVLDNDGKAYVNVPWENTWRPLGNGATDACAGNDSRLSDSRPASDVYSWAKAQNKPSYNLDEVSDGTTRKLSNYLPLGGGNMTGSITLKGSDLLLGTSNSSSNDSGDIVWYYGNGNEKARIWTDDSYAAAKGLNFRLYDSSGNNLVNTTLALASQLGSYLPTSGGTMSGAITFSQYGTSINFAGGESLDGYGNFYFGTNSQSWSVLNGSTHLLIVQKSTGNVGIGDANPAYKLEVGGNCRIATKLMVATTDQSNELNVGGNIGCNYLYASSDVQVTSDERDKDVIGDVELTVEQIAKMPAVLYKWKDGRDSLVHVGTLAQKWEPILPAAVGIKDDDRHTRSFSYSAAAYAMAHADALAICDLKKQKADACVIDALLRRISKLEAEIKKLKSA